MLESWDVSAPLCPLTVMAPMGRKWTDTSCLWRLVCFGSVERERRVYPIKTPDSPASFYVPRATYTPPAPALRRQKSVAASLPLGTALSKSLVTSGSASLSDHELGWPLPLLAGREASAQGFPHWQLPWLRSLSLAGLPAFLLTGSSVRSLLHTRHFKLRPNGFDLEARTGQSSIDKTFLVTKRPGPCGPVGKEQKPSSVNRSRASYSVKEDTKLKETPKAGA